MNLVSDSPTRKIWESGDLYRIVWRSEAFGIRVRPAFFATVRCETPGYPRWDFAVHRRPYKTFEAAVKACDCNRRLWGKFVRLSHARGRRVERLRLLDARGRRGRAHVLGSMPTWAGEAAHPSLVKLHFGGRK